MRNALKKVIGEKNVESFSVHHRNKHIRYF